MILSDHRVQPDQGSGNLRLHHRLLTATIKPVPRDVGPPRLHQGADQGCLHAGQFVQSGRRQAASSSTHSYVSGSSCSPDSNAVSRLERSDRRVLAVAERRSMVSRKASSWAVISCWWAMLGTVTRTLATLSLLRFCTEDPAAKDRNCA